MPNFIRVPSLSIDTIKSTSLLSLTRHYLAENQSWIERASVLLEALNPNNDIDSVIEVLNELATDFDDKEAMVLFNGINPARYCAETLLASGRHFSEWTAMLNVAIPIFNLIDDDMDITTSKIDNLEEPSYNEIYPLYCCLH